MVEAHLGHARNGLYQGYDIEYPITNAVVQPKLKEGVGVDRAAEDIVRYSIAFNIVNLQVATHKSLRRPSKEAKSSFTSQTLKHQYF